MAGPQAMGGVARAAPSPDFPDGQTETGFSCQLATPAWLTRLWSRATRSCQEFGYHPLASTYVRGHANQ
jgi:hypothetical protein